MDKEIDDQPLPAGDALRKSEDHYHLLFNNMTEGFALHELVFAENGEPCDYRFIDINHAFEQLTGMQRQDFIGRTQREVLPAEDPFWFKAFSKVALTGEAIHLEHYSPPLQRHYQVYAYSPAKNQFAVIFSDISARKLAEQALREEEYLLKRLASFSEELLKTGSEQVTYKKILENLLTISKAKYGVLTLLNESTGKFTTVAVAGMKDSLIIVSKMMGFELVGKEWNEYSIENEKLKGQVVSHFSSMCELTGSVVPEIIVKAIEKLIDIGEVTVTKVIVNNKMIGDYTLIMPAGKRFENDTLVEIYSRQIDLFFTRIRAEDKLHESEEKYRTVADFTYNWEAWRAADSTYLYVSPSCERISGHTSAEFLADPNLIVQITHPDDKSQVIAHFQSTANEFKKQELEFDFRIHTPDGKTRWIAHSCTAVYAQDGNWLGRRESNRDITARKQAEEELRKNALELEAFNNHLEVTLGKTNAMAVQALENEDKIRLLNTELEKLVHTDVLTGINNRRSLFELAEREFNVAMRYRRPLSLLMFDIDDFKLINDTLGHALGDQALINITQTVRANLRSADLFGRYGGDEFIILLPQTSAQEALPFAERIHASIAAMQLDTVKGPLTLTISIGIAQTIHTSAPEPGPPSDTVERLLLRADQALYAAKQAGKNCTVIFDADKTGAG